MVDTYPRVGRAAVPAIVHEAQRRFALDVVRQLREAGFEAYWAGGCVRDELLHRVPKDYDVATNARPEQVRELFGHRRTLAIGAAFGVITVLGPRRPAPSKWPPFDRTPAIATAAIRTRSISPPPREDAIAPRLHHQRPVFRTQSSNV